MNPKKIRILIATINHNLLKSINELLLPFSEFKFIGETVSSNEAVELALNFQPDIVIVDVNMPELDGFEIATKITQVTPYIGVIIVGTAKSAEIIRRAMQSGAGDYLELPLSESKLYHSICNLYEIKHEQKKLLQKTPLIIPNRQPKVISVFSSKGGVGKTAIATNLAVALRELTREDILLIDMDLQFGDVADLLNIDPKTNIINLLNDKDNIESSEVEKYLIPHHSGIKVLAAPQQPEQADLIGDNETKYILSIFIKIFDYIILDLPPLFNEVVLGAIERSDKILLITVMEIPTIKNIKGGLEVLRKLDYSEDKITLVLNRFNKNREIKVDDITNFLGINEVFLIDDNPELVSTSINTGEPFVLRHKNSSVAKQIIKLSKSLVEYTGQYEKKKKKSLFHRFREKGI